MNSLLDLPRVTLRFGLTLDTSYIVEGSDVYFDCVVDARPKATKIMWTFDVRSAFKFKIMKSRN